MIPLIAYILSSSVVVASVDCDIARPRWAVGYLDPLADIIW